MGRRGRLRDCIDSSPPGRHRGSPWAPRGRRSGAGARSTPPSPPGGALRNLGTSSCCLSPPDGRCQHSQARERERGVSRQGHGAPRTPATGPRGPKGARIPRISVSVRVRINGAGMPIRFRVRVRARGPKGAGIPRREDDHRFILSWHLGVGYCQHVDPSSTERPAEQTPLADLPGPRGHHHVSQVAVKIP